MQVWLRTTFFKESFNKQRCCTTKKERLQVNYVFQFLNRKDSSLIIPVGNFDMPLLFFISEKALWTKFAGHFLNPTMNSADVVKVVGPKLEHNPRALLSVGALATMKLFSAMVFHMALEVALMSAFEATADTKNRRIVTLIPLPVGFSTLRVTQVN